MSDETLSTLDLDPHMCRQLIAEAEAEDLTVAGSA